MAWLLWANPTYKRGVHARWLDLTAQPSPTVMAGGIHGDCRSHYSVYALPDPHDNGPEDTSMNPQPPTAPPPPVRPDQTDKPPYQIPTMTEIANGKGRTELTAVSTFSGCGGSCLGLEWAGFDVRWASEFVPAAAEVYRLNHPGVPVDDRDIRTVTPDHLLDAAGIEPGDLDLLEGSPPCASFSTAGSREKGWGQVKKYSDTNQRTDDLFYEYARLLRDLQPRAFVAENVSGLVKGKAKGYFKLILAELRACGYRVGAKVLDAQWLGVPQRRQRLIFVGFRNDLGIDPVFPAPLPYRYTVADALPWITGYRFDTSGQYTTKDVDPNRDPAPTIAISDGAASYHRKVVGPMHGTAPAHSDWVASGRDITATMVDSTKYPAPTIVASGDNKGAGWVAAPPPTDQELAEVSIEGFAIAQDRQRLLRGSKARYLNSDLAYPDKPAPTVTQTGGTLGAAAVMLAHEPRKFTIGELRRICGFPDDFQLTGTYQQQWERLGRSVPPPMMYAVAREIAAALDA